MTLFDISVPISNTLPVYTGDRGIEIIRTSDMNAGAGYNYSLLNLGAHTGTHVDAPRHFIREGETVEQLDLDLLIGPAYVVDMTRVERTISARDLDAAHLPAGMTRLLFKTRNSALWAKTGFQKDFVAFAPDAAQWLLDYGARLVGIDYLSIEAFGSPDFAVHHMLLGAKVIIIEGLNLARIEAGAYQLICLPIKLQGAEGAPARAVLTQP